MSRKPLKFFHKYKLLGDDIVIFDKKVATVYQRLLTEVLGIPINLSKSVIGDQSNSQIEFTKRFSMRGLEMSSIKHNVLTKSSILDMLDLIDIMYERDFISRDTGHYNALKFLHQKEFEQFSFMCWVRSGVSHPFRVNDTIEISRESFNQKLADKRAQYIKEKSTHIAEYMRGDNLEVLFDRASIPYNAAAPELGSLESLLMLHPIVWGINQTGIELQSIVKRIWGGEHPELGPVEYLPVVNTNVFFSTNKDRKRYLSKLILDSFKELRDETQLKLDTPEIVRSKQG